MSSFMDCGYFIYHSGSSKGGRDSTIPTMQRRSLWPSLGYERFLQLDDDVILG
jgi:hypothetical protein